MPVSDYAKRGLSAAAGALDAFYRTTDSPGPELSVAPFGPGQATGEAVALKSLATLIAGRRAAANAREKRESQETANRYKEALTTQIQAKLSQPPKPTYKVNVPGVGEVELSGQGAASWAMGQQRIGDSNAWREVMDERLNRFHYENRADRLRKFEESRRDRDAKVGAVKRYTAAQAGLKNLDAEVEAEGERNAAAFQNVINEYLKVLKNPKIDFTQKSKAADALGITPVAGSSKIAPVYDLGDPATKDALENLVKRARDRGRLRKLTELEPQRRALAGVTLAEAGVFAGGPNDASSDWGSGLEELLRMYLDTEDESFLDEPAE